MRWATVHLARDVLLGRDVAVKVFPAVYEDTDELPRNRAEVRVLASLDHPCLVTLYDAGSVAHADGSEQVYLVMELVDGPTLAGRLRERMPRRRADARVGRTSPRRSPRSTTRRSSIATSNRRTSC